MVSVGPQFPHVIAVRSNIGRASAKPAKPEQIPALSRGTSTRVSKAIENKPEAAYLEEELSSEAAEIAPGANTTAIVPRNDAACYFRLVGAGSSPRGAALKRDIDRALDFVLRHDGKARERAAKLLGDVKKEMKPCDRARLMTNADVRDRVGLKTYKKLLIKCFGVISDVDYANLQAFQSQGLVKRYVREKFGGSAGTSVSHGTFSQLRAMVGDVRLEETIQDALEDVAKDIIDDEISCVDERGNPAGDVIALAAVDAAQDGWIARAALEAMRRYRNIEERYGTTNVFRRWVKSIIAPRDREPAVPGVSDFEVRAAIRYAIRLRVKDRQSRLRTVRTGSASSGVRVAA